MPFDGTHHQQILDDLTVDRFKSWLRHAPFFVGKSRDEDRCPLAYWLESETAEGASAKREGIEIGADKYLPAPWMTAFMNYIDLGGSSKITRRRALRTLRRLELHWKSYPPSRHVMQRSNPNAL